MPSFQVHAGGGGPAGDRAAIGEAVIVKDGFSWGAFLLSPWLWALWHRMWLAAAVLFVLEIVIAAGGVAAGLPVPAILGVRLLFGFLIGIEGAHLRGWALDRAGKPLAGIVIADDAGSAEEKAVALWLTRRPAMPPPPMVRASVPPAGSPSPRGDVLGLFPRPEGGR